MPFFYKTKLFKGLACFLNQGGCIYYFCQNLAAYLSCIHFSVKFKIWQHYTPWCVSVKSLLEVNPILGALLGWAHHF